MSVWMGTIGCIVNGAGLAMATMDVIKVRRRRGPPTSSMSVAAPRPERIAAAFRLVAGQTSKVKAIFVNIFAGINRCDWVAEGVVQRLRARWISRSR